MSIRSFAVRAIGAGTVAAAALVGLAGPASAAPAPAPHLQLGMYGPFMLTVGDRAFCNGIVDTAIETDPTRPGNITVVLIPRGMHGIGPEWVANPVCKVIVTVQASVGYNVQKKEVELNIGELPGAPVRTDLHIGSGIAQVVANASYLTPQFQYRPQASYPVMAVAIVP